ncbi:hypothetical protein ACFL96_17625 [Thermoproteota archaeon]
MEIKDLKPSEMITTRDFPVHNEHILRIYFNVAKKDKELLPPTPVVPVSIGLPLLKGKTAKEKEYNENIKDYLKKNKKVKYFMCDGSHKTTSLTLTHNKIHVAILKTDADVKEFHDLSETGEIFSFSMGKTMKKVLWQIADHLKDAEFFETVEVKTKRMIKEKVIPEFMIKYYEKSK